MNFTWGQRTYIMGIINITPDSFSGDGLLNNPDIIKSAVTQAQQFIQAGADIIDIGAQSTRPGSATITADEEIARILPVIKAIRATLNTIISVDTYYATVAQAALNEGANWVNDVWGLQMDPNMPAVIAQAACPVIIMHNRSQPQNVSLKQQLGGRYTDITYTNLIPDIIQDLQKNINLALTHGIQKKQIIIDPGLGFGKTVTQNLQLINQLHQFKTLGYPILVGPSRKSFIGYTLNLPPQDRLEGTAAAIAIAIDRGADIIRVHNVQAMTRVARMTDALVRPI